MIERTRALEIQQRAMRDWVSMLGGSAPGSRRLERDGVMAAIVPAVPERSIVNSVAYSNTSALIAALDELATAYAAAGVSAWTVWTPEFDREAIAALEAAGHKLDGDPAAMVLDDLERFDPPDLGGLDYDQDADMQTLGRINDVAYDLGPHGMAAAFANRAEGLDLRIYRARQDGEVACVLATIDHRPPAGAAGPDCGVYFVATPESARGRGLATRLVAAALVEARGRGCASSSLQSSALGRPVYANLGYELCFRLRMYERRRAVAGA